MLLQFLIEALMLGCMGGALGVLAALGVSKALAVYMGVPFIFSPGINLLAFTVSALTGVVFGFFPRQTCGQARPDRGGASRVTRERSGKAERSEA